MYKALFNMKSLQKKLAYTICLFTLIGIFFTSLTSCSIISAVFSNSDSNSPLTTEELYKKAEKSVGTIVSYKKGGSVLRTGLGFVYSDDGKILTNYHTIAGAYSSEINLNGTTHEISTVLSYDKALDIAIVKVNSTNLISLSISNEDLHLGSTVYAFGTAKSGALNFVQGTISTPCIITGEDYIHYVPTNLCNNSGGPVLNSYGEVVGINVGVDIDIENEYHKSAISTKWLDNVEFKNTLSFLEFYEKEGDPFSILKNYVIKNGIYNSQSQNYKVLMSPVSQYINPKEDTFFLIYDAANNELEFTYMCTSYNNPKMFDFIVTEELTGNYLWAFIDDYDNFMHGNVVAQTFTMGTNLNYEYNNISSPELRNSAKELSTSMLGTLLYNSNIFLLKKTGVGIVDLGFHCHLLTN